jgi:hypothetical protein
MAPYGFSFSFANETTIFQSFMGCPADTWIKKTAGGNVGSAPVADEISR